MSLTERILIASEPARVFHALVHPSSLAEWWGCTAVIEPRPGGNWVGGWGEGEGGYGHQTVIWAELARFEPVSALTLRMGSTEIQLGLTQDPQGTVVSVTQVGYPASTPDEERAALQSWVDMVSSLKAWVEVRFPYTPPRPAPQPAPQPAPRPQPVAQAQPAAQAIPGMSDPYGAAQAVAQGGVRVLDDGGFGVTDPHAVIKSWSKEQGFGYATHPQLGDVVFDYDGCDFEPSPGDKVLLLVIAKAWNGKPKVKRIACPAKGSNINK
ncbi:MAG: SRPBCC domain-containing protein [Polyangia bacterium]|jgi:uncharacterized protein YndB with AHSA1/START domain|nr:SRPBCC domain-containing protein [Polyangia bacterium]